MFSRAIVLSFVFHNEFAGELVATDPACAGGCSIHWATRSHFHCDSKAGFEPATNRSEV